jgi:hypothetical protein
VKKTLAEVMAEERQRAQEEAIVREMREAEEESARKAKQASVTWAAVPSAAPTLREIMEAEAKAERSQRSQLTSSFAPVTASMPEQRAGWGPWAASTNAKVLEEKVLFCGCVYP